MALRAVFGRKMAAITFSGQAGPDRDPGFPQRYLTTSVPTRAAASYGLTAPPVDLSRLPEVNRQRALVMRKMREIAEKSGNG